MEKQPLSIYTANRALIVLTLLFVIAGFVAAIIGYFSTSPLAALVFRVSLIVLLAANLERHS